MRPGRIAVLAALPVLALLGAARGTLPPAPVLAHDVASFGEGLAAAARVVTDGHPSLVAPPARRSAPTAVQAPRPQFPAPRAAQAPGARPSAAPVQAAPVARAAPAPAPRTATYVDGYPYADDTSGGLDPWGFTKRQCVSYVAWQLAQASRAIDNADGWGSALDWDDAARRHGHAVGSRAVVGSVAQWNAGESGAWWSGASSAADGRFSAGPYGHVGWVTRVYDDGSVLVAQYNGAGDRSFSTMRVNAPRYLRL